MRKEQFEGTLVAGEGQTVEFKTSLAEQNEAIQTMVAFANAQGGKVLIGVKNDGTAVPVDIGANTLENLANAIKNQTYPTLPVFIDTVDYDGKKVVVVEVPPDVPPLVGVCLYSSDPIPLDKPVDANTLQAYRRVGRTNSKEDFMRLRPPLPSDPKVLLALGDKGQNPQRFFPSEFDGYVWVENGSPTAHVIVFRLDPPLCQSSTRIASLPDHSMNHRSDFSFGFAKSPNEPIPSARVIAVYKDERGLTWEAMRRLDVLSPSASAHPKLIDADFSRRIVEFPPKIG